MKKGRLQLASAVSLGVLAAVAFGGQARADNIAFSSLQINDFTLAFTGGTLATATIVNSSGDSATLNGAGSAPGSSIGNPTADVAGQCVGNCAGLTPNLMTPLSPAPPITQVFSRSDAYVLPNGSGGLNAGSVAESQLVGTATAFASGTAGTTSKFTFTSTTTVGMSFSAILDMLAENLVPGGSVLVKAAWTAELDLISGNTTTKLATFVPNGSAASDLNITADGTLAGLGGSVTADDCSLQNSSLGATSSPQTNPYNCTGNFGVSITGLNSTSTYQLVIGQQVTINATSVPEPKTLGMLAAGLLGVGFFMRRRQNKA